MQNLDGKVFSTVSNSMNGEVSSETKFYYRQKGRLIWAEYSGGMIIKGHLLGVMIKNGHLEFNYHHINTRGEQKAGKCFSTPLKGKDDKLIFLERWKWLDDDEESGESIIVEVNN